jgi:hypothetical protein
MKGEEEMFHMSFTVPELTYICEAQRIADTLHSREQNQIALSEKPADHKHEKPASQDRKNNLGTQATTDNMTAANPELRQARGGRRNE